MKTATGELIAIFDADFIPPRDFLARTVHHFTDPSVGVVQTRWSYLNRHFNLLTEVEAMLLDGHFVIEHGARFGSGLFFNFNGTAGVLRAKMIEDAGGWQHDTLTEDSDLSYRAQLNGWRFVYVPSVDCPSELPVDTYGFQVQQSRWAKGLTQVAIKLLPRILRSKEPWRVKLEAFCHLTPNISYPLMLVMSALMLPVMIVRFYMGVFQMLTVDLPLIVASFCSIWAFYLMAQRELDRKNWKRAIVLMPALMAAGIALTLINTKAVIEALLGIKSAFARTPKYAVGDNKVKIQNASYRRRSGWLPYAELAVGGYFAYMVAYAIETWNFLAVPFLMLFVVGYWWAGFSTLYQEYQGKLQWQRERRWRSVAALEFGPKHSRSLQSKVRGASIVHEHFHRVERILGEIAAQQRKLLQQIVRDGDDVAADGIGLHDVEQLARAGPDQLDLRIGADACERPAQDGQRIATGVGNAAGEDRNATGRPVAQARNHGVHLIQRHERGDIYLDAVLQPGASPAPLNCGRAYR